MKDLVYSEALFMRLVHYCSVLQLSAHSFRFRSWSSSWIIYRI